MKTSFRFQRLTSAAACASLILPGLLLAGCGSGGGSTASGGGASLPPIDDTRGGGMQRAPMQNPSAPRQGMSTGKKVALLAGAAALYYMYNKNKQKRAAAAQSEPQYYISKNGRVYYRDANKQAHYVTAPPQGIQVPYEEAQQYSGFQGYNNARGGRTLEQLSEAGQGGGSY